MAGRTTATQRMGTAGRAPTAKARMAAELMASTLIASTAAAGLSLSVFPPLHLTVQLQVATL